jgi:CHASE3 domain sensor protein
LTADNPNQQARIPAIERDIADRLDNLKSRIDWRKGGHAEVARQFVLSGAGERQMDGLRQDVSGMESEEIDILST